MSYGSHYPFSVKRVSSFDGTLFLFPPLQAQCRYRATEPSAPHRDRLLISRPSLFTAAIFQEPPPYYFPRSHVCQLLVSSFSFYKCFLLNQLYNANRATCCTSSLNFQSFASVLPYRSISLRKRAPSWVISQRFA